MMVTITRVYENYETAEEVVDELEEAGFASDQISVVSRQNEALVAEENDDDVDSTATGATLGGVAGAGAGLLAGLGLIAIPGIGPLVAAGVLATTLAGAATGAVAGGLLGALIDYGIPEDEAHVYAESVRRGGTLVSVKADDTRADEAQRIMDRHHPIDIEQRGQTYREEGWRSYDPSAPIYTQSQADAERQRLRGEM